MFSARRELVVAALFAGATLGAGTTLAGATDAGPSPEDIVRRADGQRGVSRAHRFVARIYPESEGASRPGEHGREAATVVEVRSNGIACQLVVVLEPTVGDVMLVTPDVVWMRPRRLHRLTRIPADLRMFNGATISDVATVDLVGGYRATLRDGAGGDADEYVLDLAATKDGIRYPRATYAVGRDDFRPRRIDFLTASGRPLKTIIYAEFAAVLGQTAVTRLVVQDHVYRDSSVVEMSDFELMATVDADMFLPDYLLTLPDGAS